MADKTRAELRIGKDPYDVKLMLGDVDLVQELLVSRVTVSVDHTSVVTAKMELDLKFLRIHAERLDKLVVAEEPLRLLAEMNGFRLVPVAAGEGAFVNLREDG